MARPGDEIAAAEGRDRGDLRASHAGCEQTTEQLKVAFVQGRLTKDEFDMRVGLAFTARTYGELAILTADIAADPATVPPPGRSAGGLARSQRSRGYRAVAGTFAVFSACLLAGLEGITPDGNPVPVLVVWAVWTTFCALILGALLMLHSWRDKRAAGPLPPRPERGGPGLQGQRRAAPDHDRALPTAGPDQPRADLRVHRSRQHRPILLRRDVHKPRGTRPAPGVV
jgi:DUF1707 SHOCT-like domain